jgi:hypothetical protein
MFKSHPNFESIRFVLEPLARERISGSGDIPSEINAVVEEFDHLFPNGLDTIKL